MIKGVRIQYPRKYRQIYEFELEDKSMPAGKRNKLVNMARNNMMNNKILPNGIKLVGCKIEQLDYEEEEKK
jgi:hypothetical protein